MDGEKEFELIVVIVNSGYTEEVIEAAKGAGAKGGTLINARGTGLAEAQKFWGVEIQPEKEVVLIVIEKDLRKDVMKAICNKVGIKSKGRGMSFSLPIKDIVGFAGSQK